MAKKLYVGGLAYATSSEGLRTYFEQIGEVTSASVITDRDTGQSRGFGFVEMSSDADAQRAIDDLNDKEFEGRRLTVNEAREPGGGGAGGRPRRDGGGGGGGGGRW